MELPAVRRNYHLLEGLPTREWIDQAVSVITGALIELPALSAIISSQVELPTLV